ncbi:TAXI family TRAP transporter solute-binding subunit [Billgrantia endophytica]|uniref:C4-dicarboxylate ABC transporter substrate-binding protein n=1 Tax=Billgrantia endophytica TaxID=2033802 RepID=A0A2N7UB34_9GAMM|nr:TAXI family TRAP transporter solute-binding subunit [Halomonas endophytica]PMR77653.1 C4-dicarboxylate ABC transporter substrate-binding protein [Halomonas endophytica]
MKKLVTVTASAILATSLCTTAQASQDVTIGAASVGGTFYVWASGMASVLNKIGMNTNVEVTGGPLHNIQLVHGGELELGLVTAAPAYEGLLGIEWADGQKYDNIRAVLPMYPSYFTWWSVKDSDIKTFEDLEGKVVAMGPAGGTPDAYGRKVYDHTGIQPSQIVNAGFSDIVNQLRDGQVDAALTTAGLPHPAVAETESTHGINLITLPKEISQSFIGEYPYFGTDVVPAGTYDAVTEDQPTLTVWNFLITNKEQSDDLVYEMVKAAFEHHDTLMETHRASEHVILENIAEITVPLHPGAIRYYEEQGVDIPDRLIPED